MGLLAQRRIPCRSCWLACLLCKQAHLCSQAFGPARPPTGHERPPTQPSAASAPLLPRSLMVRAAALPGAAPLPDIPASALPALEKLTLQLAGLRSRCDARHFVQTKTLFLKCVVFSFSFLLQLRGGQFGCGVLPPAAGGCSRSPPRRTSHHPTHAPDVPFPRHLTLLSVHPTCVCSLPHGWADCAVLPALHELTSCCQAMKVQRIPPPLNCSVGACRSSGRAAFQSYSR